MFSDQVSSTSLTRDDAGINKVQRYTPWGETRTDGGLETDHTYTGQIEDTTTGLRFYNARYMDPVLGRFVSPDTIVPNAGNGQFMNRYSYVNNRPIVLNDPTGHCPPNVRHALRCAEGYDPGFEPARYVGEELVALPSTLWTVEDVLEEQAADRETLLRRQAEGVRQTFASCDGDRACIARVAASGKDQFASVSAGCTILSATAAGAVVGVPCGAAAEVGGVVYSGIEIGAQCSDARGRDCAVAIANGGVDLLTLGIVYGPLNSSSQKIYVTLGGDSAELITDSGDLIVSVAEDFAREFPDWVDSLNGRLSGGDGTSGKGPSGTNWGSGACEMGGGCG